MIRAMDVLPERLAALGPKLTYTTFPDFDRAPTLGERMEAAGFHTMAIPYLANKASWVRPGIGFERGFSDYVTFDKSLPGDDTSSQVVARALDQIDRAPPGHSFHWIHLFDPHRAGGKDPKRYRALVRHTDRALGKLVSGLRERGLWDDTALVITGDHGESFAKGHPTGHASSLYDGQVLVPLVIRIPGLAPRKYEFPVSTLDGIATILALADADLDGIDGMNLLPWLGAKRPAPTRPVFTELHRYKEGPRGQDIKAVVSGRYKLIHDRNRRTKRLFDLKADPKETEDLVETDPERLQELDVLLETFVQLGEAEHPLP
jgi:arylsulfatase A-like enzyme